MIKISWYYQYFATYKDKKENKLYFLGPYNHKGEIKEVINKSRSFASELYERFATIKKSELSDKMIKDLQAVWGFSDEEMTEILKGEERMDWKLMSYCPLEDLPTGEYIKSGYFLNSNITAYEEDRNYSYLGEPISAEEYARMLQSEMKFGVPGKRLNDYGEEYIPHSCADYSFYRYIDYDSEEYEAYELRKMIDILTDDGYDFYLKSKAENKDDYYKMDPDIELGIFLMQG